MAVTIRFQQVKPKVGKRLPVEEPPAFINAMARAFGKGPWTLDKEHIPCLHGMSAVCRFSDNPYQQLIDAIRKLGVVEVWAEPLRQRKKQLRLQTRR